MQLAQTGQALGASYRFGERVGSGAAGEVWTVTSTEGRTFAAKILRPEHADDPSLVERFVRERSVLLGLQGSNIVTVRDMVVEGSRLAIVMDYVAGGSLREVVKDVGPLRPADALTVAAEVFDALASAHSKGITHRDIKPDNVLLDQPWPQWSPGDVRVSDFGIADVVGERIRETTGLIGTPQYMPPELISRGRSGPAGDVYSTGVLLYELLAGRTPFAGPGPDFSVAYRHVSSRPPRIPVDDELWAVLDGLLSKDPVGRPTAPEAAAKLRRLAPRLADQAPLPRGEAPTEFDEIERPATLVRGAFSDADLTDLASPPAEGVSTVVPELGEAGNATIARPMPRRELSSRSESAAAAEPVETPFWRTRKALLLAGTAVLLLVAMVVGFVVLAPSGKKADTAVAAERLSTQVAGTAMPTGLSISRSASFEPSSGKVRLTLAYAAQKAPLSGDFLEVIPGLAEADGCPVVTWEGAAVSRNQASITGLDVECGWKLSDLEVPAGGSVEVSAEVAVAPADQQAFDQWLRAGAEATAAAAQDPDVKGTAYPAQRLMGVEVRTPARVVTPSPLKITLLPVWAGGADELNPLYVSPASGRPSQMLTAVTGGEEGLRFSDGCGGALAVDSSGLTVTALQITPQCTVRASVGNFTELQSPAFSITSRESSGE
ncbi:serine/threonine protein kinase [Arthrobacter zhangbolii]|uniref:non-specific serine/threonine protein kinase n=1 Tax=Arthrobacter zhangbolii TaxID=2886936 RepID=A0A9X1S9G6_9MICC|nr:serine/threonine-protein kinase [Arthrobacter zhangbolii]MCC3273640.1 serine/threonine protein kinase [Arthrobacter zhangbolii]UON92445.1 serine/threonine protein kinase [Arthrobacter zhangbolii]